MAKPRFKGNSKDLFFELVRTDFIMRYHNSVLGFIWVLLKPFLIFLILVIVFSWFFKSTDPYYHLNLLLGLLLYSYFAESTLRGVTSLYEKSNIILKVNFPKVIAIFTSVVNSFISFFFGFLVFSVFWFFSKPYNALLNIPYFLLLLLILTILSIGLNLFFSIIYTKLRDLFSIWEVMLQLVFYLSPIIYPISLVPNNFKIYYLLNPLAVIISESQKALITNQPFSLAHTFFSLALSIAIVFFGYIFFNANIKKIAENF